ncbi:PAS domain S-box-containing protein [Mucilaginibacter oryzae]|uniref:histidine kinase n=1 Tax=Mucilaginibacter oryzae TaxID=468058 RepID=A0A316HGK6_9SPHI|nr:ATP-binding protein [Mucilaginibacter oryzae]PWK79171.1 PAS domain S-box-containing protein [Mucilaginibacter oryzae]
MKLRTKYILFVVMLHLLTLVLAWFIFINNKIYFIIAEAFVLISAAVAIQLYRQLVLPIKMLMQGVEAIKDKDFNVKFLTTGKLEVDVLINVYNQMMDELRTERTRQEQQHFFLEKLIYTSPTGIIILDFDDRIQQVNPKALQALGMNEKALVGELISELAHPIFAHIKSLKSGETAVVKLDGINSFKLQKSHFIDRGFSRHFIMLEDLTAEILAAEKKVYGKVIRMMAHEVNNTIGPVNSIMQSAMKTDRLWQGHDFDEIKDALQVAMDRNQNLNLFMRNFADLVKLPPANKQPVILQKLIGSVVKLMAIRAAEKGVELLLHLPEVPITISADEQQLEQAFINITKNAIEAIESSGSVSFAMNAKQRKLVITDTGRGISPEQQANLFTPFFSTKKDGQGIGLTLVREIMLNHGFEFSLKTVADRQTEFVVYF